MTARFELVRHRDLSGVSGTGVVAEGVEFTDGSVALRWRGKYPATAVWASVDAALAVHGHEGATVARWLDPARNTNPEPSKAPNLPISATESRDA